MYHNIAKIVRFNQFLLRIHLVRQQEKGFSVKQSPGFLVSRWRILLSDFSLLENSIFFNVPQYCQNRMFNQFLSRIHLVRQQEKGFCVKQCPGFLVSRWCILLSDFSLLENSIFFNVPQYCQNRVVQSIFIEDSSCQVARKGVFCEIVPRISGFQVVHTIVRLLTFGKQYFLQCTTILPKSRGSISFLLRIHPCQQQEKGFSVKQCPRFLVSRWCILLSDFSLLENSIFFNVPQYCQNRMVQSIFIEDSSCQVARKGVFSEIVPRISGFQVAHTIVRLLTFGKQYFLQCTTILPKWCGSINFLLRIHLVRQQEKGFSVKQCPGFLVSRWHILLSDFSLLENSIFFNVPQYCQNHVVQSIFIEDSSCQVARKGVFCEIVPRISGFQVAHTIVRLLTFGKQYFLQCTTILPKLHGSINFYR